MAQNDFIKGVYGLVPDAKRHDYTQDYKKKRNDYVDALIYSYVSSQYLDIKKVIFNNPATIVYWTDGTKTVVKVGEGEIFDEEKGLAMAISKKFFGNKGSYYNQFKKWLMEKKDDGEIAGCIDKEGRFFTSPLLEQAAKEKEDEKIHNCSLWCPFCKEHINKDAKVTYFCALCKKDIDINASVVKYKECPIYNSDNKKTQIVDNEIVRCDSNCTKCGTVNKAGDLHIYHCRAVDLDVSIHADLSLDHKQDCGIYKKHIDDHDPAGAYL